MPKMQNKTGVKTIHEKLQEWGKEYERKRERRIKRFMKTIKWNTIVQHPSYRYPDKQCIGRLCRIVNGRLVTIAYLFI